ncbi:MAG: PD-(D/E)XK nuclease family protein, partial [Wujia sp.]
MALQFVLGSSGKGKSYYTYRKMIRDSIDNPDINYILLVPEQYSMALQKKMVCLHPNMGSMNIDVIGFNRLSYRVFDELNIKPANVLEDFGKSMLIRQVAGELRDELSIYGDCLDKLGFIDEVKSLMSEMYQYDIDKSRLARALEELDETEDALLIRKLRDMKLIFEAFQDRIGDEYIVAEQLTELLANYIDASALMKKSVIVMDGFTGFTPIQLKVLSKLFVNAIDVTVILTIDRKHYDRKTLNPHELFYLTKETISKVKELAIRSKVQVKEDIFIEGEKGRWSNTDSGLQHLEANLFRYPYKRYADIPSGISIDVYDNGRKEINGVAFRIRELIRTGDYRYRDIALVCGSLEQQAAYVKQLFPIYDIPYFLDYNEPLKNNPYVDSIGHLLRIVDENFSYDSVFAFLKSGVMDISIDDIELLENDVLEKGIRGYSWWNGEWNCETEEIRAYIMEILSPFYLRTKGKGNIATTYVEALKDIMDKLSYEEGLEEQPHIFESIIKALDKILAIMPQEKMDAREFRDILEVGMKDISIGRIPGCLDQVIVGDITRTRLDDIKVLFILGMNDGIIPNTGVAPQIISDMDKERLLGFNLELAPTERMNAYTQQFYLYLNMTKPSEKLYISYTTMSDGNEPMRPSYIIGRINNIFPKLAVVNNRDHIMVSTREASVSGLIQGMRKLMEGDTENLESTLSLYRLYMDFDEEGLMSRIKDAMTYSNIPESLSKDVSDLLKLRLAVLSVSRLEQYAKCAYSFFLRYTLGIDERKMKTIDKRDVGNILHSAMEALYRHVHDNLDNDWTKLEQEKRDELITGFVYKVFDENFDTEGK